MQITLYIENKNCIESYEKLSNSLKSKLFTEILFV